MMSITPGQLAVAGGYIARTWGDYGYRVEEITAALSALVSEMHARAARS
jgi:hypothetical protein